MGTHIVKTLSYSPFVYDENKPLPSAGEVKRASADDSVAAMDEHLVRLIAVAVDDPSLIKELTVKHKENKSKDSKKKQVQVAGVDKLLACLPPPIIRRVQGGRQEDCA